MTHGVTDLMTSLAVIFMLLFAAYVTKVSETVAHTPTSPEPTVRQPNIDLQTVLRDHFRRFDLLLQADPLDVNVLQIVVPEALLNFEFDKGTLSGAAERFLAEAMPTYATLLCGAFRDRIQSFVIEGHTDDRGTDIHNLKLSQERSLNVMVKSLEVIRQAVPWAYACFQEKTSASGRGRQDLVYDEIQLPDRGKSRRVIFKLRFRPHAPSASS
ncbi:membrane protein [Nitrospira sp.]|nr:membrane protein [Nitrospira sp.]